MSDSPTRPLRSLRRLILAGAAVAVVPMAVSACAPSVPSTPTTSTTAAATTTGTPVPAANGPLITSFQIIDDPSCSGSTVDVPVSWSTRDAQTVKFDVDGQPLSASANQPLNGVGKVTLPCDGREHEVVLVAVGSGKQVAVSRQVNTSTAPPPPSAPSIIRFDVLDDITCGGGTVEAPAAWLTQNTQAVNFSVDGQPLPVAAGFSTSGVGNIPVPCDGNAHKVTLTATGTGPASSLSRSVNTTVSSGGGPTNLTGVTQAPNGPTILTGVTQAPSGPTLLTGETEAPR